MLKPLSGIVIALACCGFFAGAHASTVAARSFEECRELAIQRGLVRPHYPHRYKMLTGFKAKTKPKGFMAQCLAGKLT